MRSGRCTASSRERGLFLRPQMHLQTERGFSAAHPLRTAAGLECPSLSTHSLFPTPPFQSLTSAGRLGTWGLKEVNGGQGTLANYAKFGGCLLKYILLLQFFPLACGGGVGTHGCVHGCHSVGVRVGSEGWGAGSQEVLFGHHVCSGNTQNWFTGGSTVSLSYIHPWLFPLKKRFLHWRSTAGWRHRRGFLDHAPAGQEKAPTTDKEDCRK